jgi:capsule polysaccharide export protein KpsE/RkpR
MTTMTFDKLAYLDRLKAAGFTEPQARGMADGLDQALREEVATKSDLAALRSEIGQLRVEFKSDLGVLKSELKGEMGELKGEMGELKAEMGELKGEMGVLKGEMGSLRGELLVAMKADKIDFLKWVMMLIVGQTAVFTALKLLGH